MHWQVYDGAAGREDQHVASFSSEEHAIKFCTLMNDESEEMTFWYMLNPWVRP